VYEKFFSLEETPFVLTPNPRVLFRSKGHHEILASLLYGITSQKGLMALFGDVGTGKTTLCRALLRELPREVQSALVLNPHLSDIELMGAILEDLGVQRRGSTKGEMMTILSEYLLAAGGEGKTVVVILDEAQQMSVAALEQIRILSNLETPTRKLLQIVLVGQPELEEKLKQRELRQLDQRIGIRCYLRALPRKETFRYIEHRLRAAGLSGTLPFTRPAMATVHRHARGIPRVINLVCDRALMAAYSARARQIPASMVRTAIRNLDGAGRRGWWPPRRVALAAGVLAGLALAGAGATASWNAWKVRVASGPEPPALVQATDPSITPVAASPAPASDPAPSAAPATAPARAESPVTADGARRLLVQVLKLWGVNDDLSDPVVAGWPTGPGGTLDLPAIAARYQLSATFLPETTLGELQAIALPALIEQNEPSGPRWYLLRRLQGEVAVISGASGDTAQHTPTQVDMRWSHSAWILWRNIDELPANPVKDMTSTVFATVALRLHKLGHLTPPLPRAQDVRFEQAVREFQRGVGLPEDGIVGPRTTLALSRVIGGKFNPTIVAR
jgi:general secretion pathway protein A